MVAGFGFARQVIKVITKDRTRDVISLIDERLRNEEFSKDREFVAICAWVRERLLEEELDSDELFGRIQSYAVNKQCKKPTIASDLEKALTMGRPLDVFIFEMMKLKAPGNRSLFIFAFFSVVKSSA